jgi:hypothetical protein
MYFPLCVSTVVAEGMCHTLQPSTYRSVYVHHSTSEERIWHLPANLTLKELEGVEISAVKETMAEVARSGKLYSTIFHKILKLEV